MFYTYVLYSVKFDKLYVGQTNFLQMRLEEHNRGLSNFTKRYKPWQLIHYEEFKTRSEAMKREKELKSHKGRDFIRTHFLNGRFRQMPD